MKIRNGFVSNSSSSSFILKIEDKGFETREEFFKYLDDILVIKEYDWGDLDEENTERLNMNYKQNLYDHLFSLYHMEEFASSEDVTDAIENINEWVPARIDDFRKTLEESPNLHENRVKELKEEIESSETLLEDVKQYAQKTDNTKYIKVEIDNTREPYGFDSYSPHRIEDDYDKIYWPLCYYTDSIAHDEPLFKDHKNVLEGL